MNPVVGLCIIPSALLTAAVGMTAPSGSPPTLKVVAGARNVAPIITVLATARAAEARGSVQTDTLSKRYSAARLVPFEASRRQMHRVLLQARMQCSEWSEPAVNLGDYGQLELQWWCGEKSLTLVVDGARMNYLKAWGDDLQSDMEDGEVEDAPGFLDLWSWLQG